MRAVVAPTPFSRYHLGAILGVHAMRCLQWMWSALVLIALSPIIAILLFDLRRLERKHAACKTPGA